MSILRLSYALAGYFERQLNLDEDKTDILRYGFEVIIGESVKIITLFFLAYLLQLTSYVLVSLLTVGIYRLFSGGYHSETYERCFIHSLILFLGMGKMTQVLLPYFRLQVALLFAIVVVTFVWTLWIAIKWAPTETANKPLSPLEKTKQRKLSICWVVLWFIVTSYLLLWFPLERTSFIVLGTLIAHIFQTISVTPTGFRIMRSADTLADKLTIKIIRKRRDKLCLKKYFH